MNLKEKDEFIIMLLLENNCYNNINFSDYMKDHYDTEKFNNRYNQLLDNFLKDYALNKTEKSD